MNNLLYSSDGHPIPSIVFDLFFYGEVEAGIRLQRPFAESVIDHVQECAVCQFSILMQAKCMSSNQDMTLGELINRAREDLRFTTEGSDDEFLAVYF